MAEITHSFLDELRRPSLLANRIVEKLFTDITSNWLNAERRCLSAGGWFFISCRYWRRDDISAVELAGT